MKVTSKFCTKHWRQNEEVTYFDTVLSSTETTATVPAVTPAGFEEPLKSKILTIWEMDNLVCKECWNGSLEVTGANPTNNNLIS